MPLPVEFHEHVGLSIMLTILSKTNFDNELALIAFDRTKEVYWGFLTLITAVKEVRRNRLSTNTTTTGGGENARSECHNNLSDSVDVIHTSSCHEAAGGPRLVTETITRLKTEFDELKSTLDQFIIDKTALEETMSSK